MIRRWPLLAFLNHHRLIETRPSWHQTAFHFCGCCCTRSPSTPQYQAQNSRNSLVFSTARPRRLGLSKGPHATSVYWLFPTEVGIPCWYHRAVNEENGHSLHHSLHAFFCLTLLYVDKFKRHPATGLMSVWSHQADARHVHAAHVLLEGALQGLRDSSHTSLPPTFAVLCYTGWTNPKPSCSEFSFSLIGWEFLTWNPPGYLTLAGLSLLKQPFHQYHHVYRLVRV